MSSNDDLKRPEARTWHIESIGPEDTAEVAPGIWAALPVRATTVNSENGYIVSLTLDLTGEGIRATGTTVTALEGSPPITSSTMRAIKFGELVQSAIEAVVSRSGTVNAGIVGSSAVGRVLRASPRVLATERGRGWATDPESRRALLRDVADTFNLAKLLGIPPVRYIQSLSGIPRSTAGHWVKLARDEGYLTPATGNKNGDD